jgi:hypothetical protein
MEFKSDGENLSPQQKIGGEIRDLDIPTFFYTALDQDLLEPYSSSPFESAIQPVLFSTGVHERSAPRREARDPSAPRHPDRVGEVQGEPALRGRARLEDRCAST